MNKPLRVDTSRLELLDETLYNTACSVCEKLQSRWSMKIPGETADELSPVCSLCFINESNWGKSRVGEIRTYLREVLTNNPVRKMLLSADGDLVSVGDADFILGILVWTSRQWDVAENRGNP